MALKWDTTLSEAEIEVAFQRWREQVKAARPSFRHRVLDWMVSDSGMDAALMISFGAVAGTVVLTLVAVVVKVVHLVAR